MQSNMQSSAFDLNLTKTYIHVYKRYRQNNNKYIYFQIKINFLANIDVH